MTLPKQLRDVITQYWGFATLRPIQSEAMSAVLKKQDSLVVMPTGGGKSLCYQAPAIMLPGLTVVVSPLIALMKDQVDSLARNGIDAVRLDSSLSSEQVQGAYAAIREGRTKIVFVSPERLVNTSTFQVLRDAKTNTIAIDEAHCISHWGHDFRPEYRMLSRLREFFPGASVHAYTATATENVREDIVHQLQLQNPVIHVGNFDRPNLTYRVLPQTDLLSQIRTVLDRRKNEAGIIYCLRRADVDTYTEQLKKLHYRVVPYHAGMSPEARKQSHDLFASEEADIVVATIAFGMGIDRSNVRFVIHACVPKTIEHYQQETGRAGRDGLPSECVLFFSMADVVALRKIIEKSALEANAPPEFVTASIEQLGKMTRYAVGAVCRHRALVQHFGQDYEAERCGACDVCLGETQDVPDCTLIAQKILSCVARVKESFGTNHVIDVLRGADTEMIRSRGHQQLSTYGLLKSISKPELRDYIFQLVGQNVLSQAEGEYPVLKLNAASWAVMKGQQTVRLIQMSAPKADKPAKGTLPEGADPALFQALRELRRENATGLGVPPYVIFADSVLAEFARCRPTNAQRMRLVSGVGDAKLRDFGEMFIDVITEYATHHQLSTNLPPLKYAEVEPASPKKISANKQQSFRLFQEQYAIEDVIHQTKLSRSTVYSHLVDYITQEKPRSIDTWVEPAIQRRVTAVAEEFGTGRLKPAYIALNEQVNYDDIRVIFAYIESSRVA